MDKIKTKILEFWVSWAVVFGAILIATIVASNSIKYWGVIISLLYWILFIYLYTQEYNGLINAVLQRFPNVHEKVFGQTTSVKDKYQKLICWDSDPITSEMYNEDLNIQNRYLKIKELDTFKIVLFISVIIIMVVTLIIY
ncbi:MAG: hypothetical protein RR911_00380 [Oscillospiraceae bacterium]